MTAFLYLQKFEDGAPVAMPFQPLMDILSRFGTPGRGRGDVEITLPPDMMAAGCTIIGSLESGATCVGFERPRFDAALRRVVWECIECFGCAVFDDSLDTVCTTLDGVSALPANLVAACTNGVRQISSAQQLWPDELEIGVQGSPRPALRYSNANANGPNFQFFDYAVFDKKELYIELRIRPEACNPGTLRVLRNLELRVDAAISTNPEYCVLYRYANHESPLCVLESPRMGDLANRTTIISPMFGEEALKTCFIADREVFSSELIQAMKLTKHAHEKYQLALDGSIASIDTLARLLDKLHISYCQERNSQPPERPFVSTIATNWAKIAGGYLGTVIRQQIGAQWGYVTRGQQRLLMVRTHRGRICNPRLLVLDHIINGPRNSIADYFHQLMKSDASATPRSEDIVCNIPGFCQILLGASQFNSGGGLPLETQIPRDKLDFSVNSLRHLDLYLAQVTRQPGTFSDQTLSNLMLAAGAYLGEVIRSNTAEAGYWQWVTYDDFAREQPDFVQKRPRDFGFLAILDNDKQMTYPLAHVAAILSGVEIASTHAYARQLVGKDTAAEKEEKGNQESGTNSKTATHAVHEPPSEKEALRAERQAEGIAVVFGFLPRVLTWIVLVYATKTTLSEFIRISGSLSSVKSVLYILWIASPCILLGWVSLKVDRNFLRDSAILFASVMLAFFGMGAYGINLSQSSGLQDAKVFIWVSLVQLIWAGGWIYVLNRKT